MTTITRTSKPLTSRRAFITRLVSGVLVINVLVLGIAAVSLLHSRQQHVERSAISTQNLAQSLGQTVANIFDKADVVLLAVVDEAEKQIARGGINGAELNAYIARQKARIPELANMRLANGQGDVLYGTGLVSGSPVNVADRDYFTSVRTSSPGGLFLAKPVLGRFTQEWVLNVSRRVNHPDGTFAGVVFATFSIEYFIKQFSSFDLGKQGVVTLRAKDLSVVARYPEPEGPGSSVGITTVTSELRQLIQSGQTAVTYRATSTIDNIERTFSCRSVSRYPLYIIVGRASSDYLAEWWDEVSMILGLVALFLAVTVSASWLSYRNWCREKLVQDELSRHRAHLEDLVKERTVELEVKNDQLEEAQRIAHIGSWEVDHLSGRLSWSREIYRIFGLEPAPVGPVYQDFLTAVHPEDRQKVNDAYTKSVRERSPYSITFRVMRPDGGVRYMDAEGETSYDDTGNPLRSVGTAQDVTERTVVGMALRESEERFRLAMEATSDGIWDWDFVGNTGYFSPGYYRLLGYDPDEFPMSFEMWCNLIHPEDRDHTQKINNDFREARIPKFESEFRMQAKSGEWRWILSRGKAVCRDSDGHALRVIGTHADITERKQAEVAVQESERGLRIALNAARMVTYAWDPATDQMTFNGDFEGIYGRPPFARADEGFAMVHPDDLPLHRATIERAAREGGAYTMEFRVIRQDNGAVVWIEDRGEVFLDEAGRVRLVYGAGVDITERKNAEVEIQRLKNYLINIIDSMPSVLVGIDHEGSITLWNRQAEEATGIDPRDAVGKPAGALLSEFSPWIDSLRDDMAKGHRPVSLEKLLIVRDGDRRFYDLILYPLTANGIQGSVMRIEDVTERARIQELMVQTEKMMSIGGLAAGMAHEINNPLGIIAHAAQNIERRLLADLSANERTAGEVGLSLERIRTYLDKRGIPEFIRDIRDAADRAARIIENMLRFSRKSDASREPVDLAELLERAVELAASDYDFRSIEIVREFAPDMPPVPVVVVEIEQVVLNLLKNAAQAMGATPSERQPRITLRLRREKQYALLEVADNGPGMENDVMRRVFEPFFTTKDVGVGTGLGLSVSYAIVTQNHKGLMGVESAPGHGTRFSVRLPLNQGGLP